jgi:hypothetical protein
VYQDRNLRIFGEKIAHDEHREGRELGIRLVTGWLPWTTGSHGELHEKLTFSLPISQIPGKKLNSLLVSK